ncbi:MAG: EpsI family protein [Phycisphaerales bacterium]|nr:MAG: EpsI family protein [Phycisphaerales bacterium]
MVIAALAAAAIMLAGGGYYRVLAGRYARAVESVRMPEGWLNALPLEIDGWRGHDEPLERSVIRATDTDAHLNRVYVNAAGTKAVALFVGYGIRLRDLLPHRPEVCYPGNGWLLSQRDDLQLDPGDGSSVTCRLLSFRKGGFSADDVSVLNYYVVDGQYCADVSALRERAVQETAAQSYSVQVQISTPGGIGADPRGVLVEFARACAPLLRELMPDRLGTGAAAPVAKAEVEP